MADPDAFEFGPFRLLVQRRELLARGVPVTLGQRAFEVLLALVRRPGQLVTKDELLAEVWPRLVVEENNLQAQISAVRKVLRAAADGERYLVTVAGRGYRFVAPVNTARADTQFANAMARGEAAAAPAAVDATNLPRRLTRLIGRERDVATLTKQLTAHRLVTLTGAGGVGKTQLAIEIGSAVASAFPNGVWFAGLAPLRDPHLVLSAVAEALRSSTGGVKANLGGLADALNDRQVLLILDNCEHVLAEASRIAEALLGSCPQLSILACSRERLGVPGEIVFRVPSLATPEPDAPLTAVDALASPAVQLFVERAGGLGIDFALTDGNAAPVATICRQLDGIPLAIELAAPRLKVLSLSQLARGLGERFRLLTAGCRTALPRHQTLQALIDWSYEPLIASEKLFMQRFSIFSGSTALPSIQAVLADRDIPLERMLDVLASLIEKSLIVTHPGDDETRYSMLESTRLYAREKLAGGAAEMSERHARHFATRLAEASRSWDFTASRDWARTYAADLDNVRSALEWAFGADGDIAIGLDLVGHSHVLWAELGLLLEHRYWVDTALRRCTPSTSPETVARLLSWGAGDVKQIDDPAEHQDALRAAEIYRELGDKAAEGRMLLRAGAARLSPDNVGEGEHLLDHARALLAEGGNTKSLARCFGALATARLFAGDTAAAAKRHAEAVQIYRAIGELSEPENVKALRA